MGAGGAVMTGGAGRGGGSSLRRLPARAASARGRGRSPDGARAARPAARREPAEPATLPILHRVAVGPRRDPLHLPWSSTFHGRGSRPRCTAGTRARSRRGIRRRSGAQRRTLSRTLRHAAAQRVIRRPARRTHAADGVDVARCRRSSPSRRGAPARSPRRRRRRRSEAPQPSPRAARAACPPRRMSARGSPQRRRAPADRCPRQVPSPPADSNRSTRCALRQTLAERDDAHAVGRRPPRSPVRSCGRFCSAARPTQAATMRESLEPEHRSGDRSLVGALGRGNSGRHDSYAIVRSHMPAFGGRSLDSCNCDHPALQGSRQDQLGSRIGGSPRASDAASRTTSRAGCTRVAGGTPAR